MKCAEFHKTYRDPEFYKEHKKLTGEKPAPLSDKI
jgi:hypothetical protein